MRKPNAQSIISSLRKTTTRHSPEILIAIGITGMVSTTIMAVRATPKAMSMMEADMRFRRRRTADSKTKLLTKREIFLITWKCYIPSVVTGAFSIACLIGANSINTKRNAALATAYTLSESALTVYKDKVVETLGEKKEQTIHDAIAKDKLERNPVEQSNIIITNKGETLCYDAWSGRYFKSDIEKLKSMINDLNRRMLDDEYLSLNDLYYEIGLDNIKLAENLGWNVNQGLIDLHFSSQLATDGTPCLVLDYQVAPKYGYCDYH